MSDEIPTIHYTNRYQKRCCASPFVIWFRERSGSTFLSSMLNSHPDILCRQEDFDLIASDTGEEGDLLVFKGKTYARQLRVFNGLEKNPTREVAIDHLRCMLSQDKLSCGFKFKYDIQIACYPEIVDELHWIAKKLRVLLLNRNNLLKQAVSRQNMERLQQAQNNSNLRSENKLPPITLDIDRAVHYASCLMAENDRFNNSVGQFLNVKTVIYEDLLMNPQEEMKAILDFMGVDSSIECVPTTFKATPDSLQKAIANYDELASAVVGTEFESMLDS